MLVNQKSRRHPVAIICVALVAILIAGSSASAARTPEQVSEGQARPEGRSLAEEASVDALFDRLKIEREAGRDIVDRQSVIQPMLDQLREEVPETYAGAWFNSTSTSATYALVGEPTRRQQAIANDSPIAFVSVRYSFEDLQDVRRQVMSLLDMSMQAELSSYLDPQSNEVVIGVPPKHERAVRLAVEESAAEQPVRFEVDTLSSMEAVCTFPNCDSPLRGGVRLTPTGTTGVCSTGFNVSSASDGLPYVLTAGHCLQTATRWRMYEPSNSAWRDVGNVWNWYNNAAGDAGIVRVEDAAAWNPGRDVVVYFSSDGVVPTAYDNSYHIGAVGNSSIGLIVCRSGAMSGTTCGTVDQLGYSPPGDITGGLGRVDAAGGRTCQGDSGGPILKSHTGYGILTNIIGNNLYTINRTLAPGTSHTPTCSDEFFAYQGLNGAAAALNVTVNN